MRTAIVSGHFQGFPPSPPPPPPPRDSFKRFKPYLPVLEVRYETAIHSQYHKTVNRWDHISEFQSQFYFLDQSDSKCKRTDKLTNNLKLGITMQNTRLIIPVAGLQLFKVPLHLATGWSQLKTHT